MNYAQLQAELRGMSKRDAVNRLHEHADTKSRSWCERNLQHLMALEPEDFARLVAHSDPTANAAIRNIMKQKNGPGALSPKIRTEAVQSNTHERV